MHTYRFLSVIIHLAVYLPFFAVQFLYNFDIANHPGGTASVKNFAKVSAVSAKHAQKLAKSTGHSPAKGKIRLNKRFQPESIVAFNVFHSAPQVQWVTCPKPNHLNTELHSVLLSFHQPLRGPPAVVYNFV